MIVTDGQDTVILVNPRMLRAGGSPFAQTVTNTLLEAAGDGVIHLAAAV